MEPITKQQGTTPEVLAPYLPYEVEVKDLDPAGPQCIVTGIDLDGEELTCWDTVREQECTVGMRNVLPVLRPFASLCTPLPDGTVPAVEVAKLAHYAGTGEWGIIESCTRFVTLRNPEKRMDCCIENNWQLNLLTYDLAMAAHLSSQVDIIDYLRRNHFAVGLTADQFLPKP